MLLLPPKRTGQAKPYTSIPRINWDHSITAGLVSYLYDTGTGYVIDLVDDSVATLINGSGQVATVSPSTFGSGFKYGNASTTDMINSGFNTKAANLFTNAPYCVAGGFMHVVAPQSTGNIYSMNDPNLDFGLQLQISGSNYEIIYAGATSGDERYITVYTFSQNKFTTVVANAATATAGSIYVNGALDGTFTGNATTVTSSTMQTIINGAFLNNFTSGGGGAAGFVYFIGQWNRALTAAEAQLIHNDPYSFLIYPEDELFDLKTPPSAALGMGWYRREFEGVLPKPFIVESAPALGIAKLTVVATPKPIIWREHDNVPFAKGRDDPGARGTSLTIPISHPIISWREHDNVPFAKGRDDPGARGTSLTIPLAAPIIPRTSHDLNPFAQGRDEPARWRIRSLPTPSPVLLAPHDFNPFALGRSEPPATGWRSLPTPPPVLLAPHDFNPFAQGRSERPASGVALTIPTVPPVYNAPHDFNPFALGRSEPPAMGLPKLLITTLAPLVFWREHDNTPYAQGRSEPSSRVFQLIIPTAPPVLNAPHDFNPFVSGRSEPTSRVFQLAIPIVPPVYNPPHDFNPFAQGRSEPSPFVLSLTIPTVPPVYNAPHDFNPFVLGKSEPPATGWRSLPTPSPVLLAPHDFNPFAQGRSEPSPWRIPILVTPVQIYNAPHDFNPFALGKSEAPAIGWPQLLIAVLAPIVFNAPAIHTAFVQGSSEPAANGWMILQQPFVTVTTFHALPFFDTVGSLKTM